MSDQPSDQAGTDGSTPRGGLIVTRRAPDVDAFDPTGLGSAAKWASTGFASLTALLTFFGIKDGMLTRILAEDPTASLWALILVGTGVVLSLFGIAVRRDVYLYSAWIFLGIIVMSACSAILLRDIDEADVTDVMLVVSFIVLGIGFLWSAIRHHTIALTAGILVLAVAATALGLYAAAKIAVAAKGGPEDLRVTAKLTGDSPNRTLEVTLAGAKQDTGIVAVVGYRTERDPGTAQPETALASPLWETYFNSDDTRTVSETYAIPVNTTRWAEVGIEVCTDDSADPAEGDERPNCAPAERSYYRTDGAETPSAALSGSLARAKDAQSVTAVVTGRNVTAEERVIVVVRAHRPGDATITLLTATAIPDSSGTVSWESELGTLGRQLSLHAVVCSGPVTPKQRGPSTEGSNPFIQECRPSSASNIVAMNRRPR